MPNLLNIVAALAIVLAIIAGSSFLLNNLRSKRLGQGQLINIHSSVSVGTRERVILIEIAGEWILVGVTSTNINTLMRLDHAQASTASTENSKSQVKSWLSTYLMKHNAA